ncbi:hypothetical protein BaRGS_00020638 [Batillaria attramentaria]|uniref:Uncharacterized protein n=1 Tax=Batillaria attramentaria TaxID=370345 RepID=A0ABD0KLT6_9CAEN
MGRDFSAVLLMLFVFTTISLALPVRRSDDPEPLDAVVQQLTADLGSLKARMAAGMNALKSELTAKSSEIQTLRNELQRLQAADENIVAFTATISEASIRETTNGIMRNGRGMVRGNNDANGRHITTGATLSLNAGDTITVNHAGWSSGFVDGGAEAVFSGFKLR